MPHLFACLLSQRVSGDQNAAHSWPGFINGAGLILAQKGTGIQKLQGKQPERKASIIQVLGQFLRFFPNAWFAKGILGAGENRIGLAAGDTKIASEKGVRCGFTHGCVSENKKTDLPGSVPGRCLVPMASSSPSADRHGYLTRK